jgi:hypothetical protein
MRVYNEFNVISEQWRSSVKVFRVVLTSVWNSALWVERRKDLC